MIRKDLMIGFLKSIGEETNIMKGDAISFIVDKEREAEIAEKAEAMNCFLQVSKRDKDVIAIAHEDESGKKKRIAIIKLIEISNEMKNERNDDAKIFIEYSKDKGLEYHVAELKIKKEGTLVEETSMLEKFLKSLNDLTREKEILKEAKLEKINSNKGLLYFPKVKGHSKEAFNEYKKCVTKVKRQMKKCF